MIDCGYVTTEREGAWDPYTMDRYTTRELAVKGALELADPGPFWVGGMYRVSAPLPSGRCVVSYVIEGIQRHSHLVVLDGEAYS